MQYYKLALKEDLARNYGRAIEFYSKSIESEELVLEAHLNLIVILITVCFDFGLTLSLISNRTYTESQISNLCENLNNLLQKSLVVFNSSEVSFWKYYKDNYYSGFSREKISDFLKQKNSNRIPYFQLYIKDLAEKRDVSLYKTEVDKLKDELSKTKTIKNEYILSLIDSAEKQGKINTTLE